MSKVGKPREDYGILLPCTPETFSEFISGLLGKPQTIRKDFDHDFELTRPDIENLYHLVNQRVHQQNEASLTQFTIQIRYGDGSSVLLNAYEDFEQYTEIRPLVSVGVVMSWTFLIKFRGKAVPEKQTVEFWARSFAKRSLLDAMADVRDELGFRVEHTARTWGTDMEGLLSGYVATLRRQEAPWRKFIHAHSGKIGIAVGLLFLAVVVAGAYFSTQRFADAQIAAARAAMATRDLATKVDFMVTRVSEGAWTQYNVALTVLFMVSMILALVFTLWAGSTASRSRESFVLLTKRAEEEKQNALARRKKRWLMFVASILGSITTGVVGNAVFMWLFS